MIIPPFTLPLAFWLVWLLLRWHFNDTTLIQLVGEKNCVDLVKKKYYQYFPLLTEHRYSLTTQHWIRMRIIKKQCDYFTEASALCSFAKLPPKEKKYVSCSPHLKDSLELLMLLCSSSQDETTEPNFRLTLSACEVRKAFFCTTVWNISQKSNSLTSRFLASHQGFRA